MKKTFTLLSILFLWAFFPVFSFSDVQTEDPDMTSKTKILESYGNLPLSFIKNKGQVNRKVAYYLKGRKATIYFTKESIVYELISSDSSFLNNSVSKNAKSLSFILKPKGVNKAVQLISYDKLPGKINYLTGNDPKKWQSNIALYKEIVYRNLYKGIDLRVYGTNSQMEYDFIVSPGADPNDITMAFDGIDSLKLDKKGNLLIETPLGNLKHLRPLIYQDINGRRHLIKGSFLVAQNTFSFDIKGYDKNQPLIIDPLTLSYSTYLGGNSNEYGMGIAVDASGCAYITGYSESTSFPVQNAYQENCGGNYDVFVTKLNPNGDNLVYSTYLGGDGGDYGYNIAVDSSGSAYITGETSSVNFPIVQAYQGTYGGGGLDAFVTKLSPNGNIISYSTYIGGSSVDYGKGIAVDLSGNAYIVGLTESTDLPTQNAYQGTKGGGQNDAFVTKLNPNGNTLAFSTYLGGRSYDSGYGIAVDETGSAYVVGYTYSGNFPTYNAYQGTHATDSDAFVTKFSPNGDTLAFSTFLGGSYHDKGWGIAVDKSGNAYVTGQTKSVDFPTQNAYQETLGGEWDVFVTKFNSNGTGLFYSTYLGGGDNDTGESIAVDASENAYVTGESKSVDFPTQNAYQETLGGPKDAFVAKFTPIDGAISFSTYLGGSNNDKGFGIAVDLSGNAYVAGYTESANFPAHNAYQENNEGGSDVFVTKLWPALPRYSITDLGINVRPYAINNSGQVIGETSSNHAFLWENGVTTDLGTLGGNRSVAYDINDFGQIVGGSEISIDEYAEWNVFLWENGVMTNIGDFSYAGRGINNLGQIVGGNYLWENGTLTYFGNLKPGGHSYAQAINDLGQVAGHADGPNYNHAFFWENGVISDLGTLGGSESKGWAINNSGQVAGWSKIEEGVYTKHVFLWEDAVMNDLGIEVSCSDFNGINDLTQIVGCIDVPYGHKHSFLWENGTAFNLNDYINGSDWDLREAYDTNNSGQIIGRGNLNGEGHGYLLTPIPSAFSPFQENFESGVLEGYWVTNSTGSGRVEVTTENLPYDGNYHLVMDSSENGIASLNEVILGINLIGRSNVMLSFYNKELGNESHIMPDTFTGSNNSDGVAISANGNTWYKVKGLTIADGTSSEWRYYELDIDAAINSAGINYNNTFQIKFQQYDSYPNTSDGFCFDDIKVFQSTPDTDNDGLSDSLENATCTDPNNADTDDDGIMDGIEDANQNGVVDSGESDPCNIDTDSDGIQDGTELGYTLNDIGPDTDTNVFQPDLDFSTNTDPLDDDTDSDGLLDGEEDINHNGRIDEGESDPGIPTSNAGLSLDMDISTRNYDDTVSSKDIELTISVPENGEIWVAVVAQGVTNLDTYQVEVSFDTERVEFIEGAEENPFDGIENLLKKNGGTTVGFQAFENVTGTVNIANALAYTDCDQAPEGTGIIALLKFRVLDIDSDNQLILGNVFFVDCNGSQEEVTSLTNGFFNACPQWDFNCNGIVNYLDLGLFADHWLFKDSDALWDTKYNLSSVPDSGNQIINYLDLAIFADHWLEETP